MTSLALLRSVTRPTSAPTTSRRGNKARLIGGGIDVTLPFAPRETERGGLADVYSAQARPGRAPVVTRDGDGTPTLSFEVLLARRDPQASVETVIGQLERLAKSGARVRIAGMSAAERGPWRLSGLTVRSQMRQRGTNAITRATATLTFLEASDANPKLGPVHGGKKGGKKGDKLPRKYEVKAGDTLRKIADRFYGEPGKWKAIARANKIKDPSKVQVGRKLTIPKLKDND